MRRFALTLAVTLASLCASLAGSLPADGATVRVQRFSDFQDVPVAGGQGRYRLRLAYQVPSSWRTRGRATGLARSFGPVGSCRFTVRLSARAVVDVDEPAAARVARLLPGSGRLVLDTGTRTNAAWRVVRTSGTDTVTALLVRPAPTVKAQSLTGRVWLEVRFVARVDPRTECHSGGPRTVGAQAGDALATAALGGFQL